MIKKCCVYNCNGNYNDENKVKVFRLPKDEIERKRWLSAVPRDNIPDSKDTVICERHWPANYATVSIHGKLRPVNPPTVFQGIPASLIPPTPNLPRSSKKSLSEIRNTVPDEINAFDEQDRIDGFENLLKHSQSFQIPFFDCSRLFILEANEKLIFQSREYLENTGIPTFVFFIYKDMSYDGFHCGIKVSISTLSANRFFKISRWSQILEALRFLQHLELTHHKKVLHQQIQAMSQSTVAERKYSVETTIRAFEYFSLSRSGYNRFRRDFELPSTKTLSRLTSITKSTDDYKFVNAIISSLLDRQKDLILLIDEVYVKPTLQYSGGTLFGKAVNNPDLLANTILTFMISAMFGGPKFVCKMLPVRKVDAKFLFEQTCLLITAIQKSAGRVIAIICDGNRLNQAFFKLFDTSSETPWQTKDDIFLLYDYVHLLKSVRNNWITEKTQELAFTQSGEVRIAKWSDLKALHSLEEKT